jgi:putative hemolysin
MLLLLAAVVGSVAATPPPAAPPTSTTTLANPASVACAKDGGTIKMVPDVAGNITGICHRKDGSACEEWALFRTGQCVLPPPQIKN